jgi:peptide/nickel transport system permease protein
VIVKNVLRNASLSLTTILGLSFAGLLGGSVVTETIFMWPGLGKMAMDAISNRDYPVVQGFVLWMSVIYIIVNLVTDIVYRLVDPRIKEAKG